MENTNNEDERVAFNQINDIFNEKISSFGLDELRERGKENNMTSLTKYNKPEMRDMLVAEFHRNWEVLKDTKLEDLRVYARENKVVGFSIAKKNELIVLIMTKVASCEERQFASTGLTKSKQNKTTVAEPKDDANTTQDSIPCPPVKGDEKKPTEDKKRAPSATKQPSGFDKPWLISSELAAFLGRKTGVEMARTEVSREINAYIRKHRLQDNDNRRIIHPNAALKQLFAMSDADELTFFNIQMYMKHHFINDADCKTTPKERAMEEKKEQEDTDRREEEGRRAEIKKQEEAVDDEKQRNDELKRKKQTIPKSVRTHVWDLYIGSNINEHRCICCKKTLIKITNYDVGHVISERDGGTLEISNLRPICSVCNHSMGCTNMVDFVKKYGYYIG